MHAVSPFAVRSGLQQAWLGVARAAPFCLSLTAHTALQNRPRRDSRQFGDRGVYRQNGSRDAQRIALRQLQSPLCCNRADTEALPVPHSPACPVRPSTANPPTRPKASTHLVVCLVSCGRERQNAFHKDSADCVIAYTQLETTICTSSPSLPPPSESPLIGPPSSSISPGNRQQFTRWSAQPSSARAAAHCQRPVATLQCRPSSRLQSPMP